MSNKIRRIVVLVEFETGKVHQVIAGEDQKTIALGTLAGPDGKVNVAQNPEPYTFEEPKNITHDQTQQEQLESPDEKPRKVRKSVVRREAKKGKTKFTGL